mmetsp:Transcript_16143/g.33102  ORF Transcript_16143/g.33102 Transcript_16143/m.33102 type:complete len:256 (-) Transcript_16143:75-842(-)
MEFFLSVIFPSVQPLDAVLDEFGNLFDPKIAPSVLVEEFNEPMDVPIGNFNGRNLENLSHNSTKLLLVQRTRAILVHLLKELLNVGPKQCCLHSFLYFCNHLHGILGGFRVRTAAIVPCLSLNRRPLLPLPLWPLWTPRRFYWILLSDHLLPFLLIFLRFPGLFLLLIRSSLPGLQHLQRHRVESQYKMFSKFFDYPPSDSILLPPVHLLNSQHALLLGSYCLLQAVSPQQIVIFVPDLVYFRRICVTVVMEVVH